MSLSTVEKRVIDEFIDLINRIMLKDESGNYYLKIKV